MDPARPLRDVFTDLTGDAGAGAAQDPAAVLAASGHPDLPDTLVAEAIVSYADTAPPEVAEHLAPYVMANSAVPAADPTASEPDPSSWLDLLAGAPDVAEFDLDSSLDDAALAGVAAGDHPTAGPSTPVDASFGHGEDGGTGHATHDEGGDPTFADFATTGPADDSLADTDALDWAAPGGPAAALPGEADADDVDDLDHTGDFDESEGSGTG
jgi:hypothetical protein